MMKIVVLGDIHGLTVWKDIIDKEQPDQVIFLGDYVSSHEGISACDLRATIPRPSCCAATTICSIWPIIGRNAAGTFHGLLS